MADGAHRCAAAARIVLADISAEIVSMSGNRKASREARPFIHACTCLAMPSGAKLCPAKPRALTA